MGNLPVIHEVGTSLVSLGDAITGHPEKARERWKNYAKESVIGSSVVAIVEVSKGDTDKAKEYLKGMGRATGKAVLGGGFLRDVPVFHELAVCGESLGDVIGGGDTESAEKRWETYVEGSVFGGGIAAVAAKIGGDDEKAKRLAVGCGKAGLRFGVTAAAVVATIATGGMAAPYGIAASATTGAVVGGGVGAASTAAVQAIDKGKVDDPGAIVGNALLGGALGGITEGFVAKSAAAKAKAAANNPIYRPRAESQLSISSEAELFSQYSSNSEGQNIFSYEGGKALRNSKFKEVWGPKSPNIKLDTQAAFEAARSEMQKLLRNRSDRTRPGKTSVLQDEKGNAFSTSSVRGNKRAKLKDTIGSEQTNVLDSIPEDARGPGHGNCAEQVAVNNSRYYRQKTNGELFKKDSDMWMQAFGQAKGAKGVYSVPVKPCGTCAAVLREFGITRNGITQITISCDYMEQMIAAGITVGCKCCQESEKK